MLLRSSVTLTQYRESVTNLYTSLNSAMFESLYHYTSTGYKKINEDLVFQRFNKHAVNIESIFKNRTDEVDYTVFRGVKKLAFHSVGETIGFKHFVSSSLDPNQAYSFTGGGTGPFYIIKPKKSGLPVSYDKNEMEILLQHDSVFTVEEVFLGANFYCEYPDSDYGITRKINAFVLKEK